MGLESLPSESSPSIRVGGHVNKQMQQNGTELKTNTDRVHLGGSHTGRHFEMDANA